MQKKIVSLAAPLALAIMAVALGWFAHAAAPLSAQGIVVDGHATRSDPAAPVVGGKAKLTYQGRLTNSSGMPINTTVNVVFKLYDSSSVLLWTSATRSMTPSNGVFTVYLGDSSDPDLPWGTLNQAVSIGVTVGGDAEMTPLQALNSVVGHSENEVGVVGSSNTGFGVNGSSNTSYGVNGSSNSYFGVNGFSESSAGVFGSSNTGYGVAGRTYDRTRAGVLATNSVVTGTALEISRGGIKATGAGGGTSTFAFIHVSSGANSGSNVTYIDNALTNGDQNAMLFVTHVLNPSGIYNNYFNRAFGVAYIAQSWTIYTEDLMPFPLGVTFNVMVINR